MIVTGRGYDRAGWMNNLHHKLSYRLHTWKPAFGLRGIRTVPAPGMPGKFLYVRAEDGGVAHQLIVYRQYEPFESSVVRTYLKPGMTVYNIGANIGYYVLLASESVGRRGTVYAFEPEPRNVELLKKNVAENNASNVKVCPSALGAERGTAMLSLSSTNSGDHRLTAIADREHVSVPVTTIDDLIEAGYPKPDVIIMDVQGSELDVVRGSIELLKSRSPLVIFTEFWPEGLNERHANGASELLEILGTSGFQFHRIDEKQKRISAVTAESLRSSVRGSTEVNLLVAR